MGVSATMATGQVVEVGRNDCAVPPGTRGVWLGVVPETGNALVLLAGGRRVALLAGQWRPEGGEWPVLRLAADPEDDAEAARGGVPDGRQLVRAVHLGVGAVGQAAGRDAVEPVGCGRALAGRAGGGAGCLTTTGAGPARRVARRAVGGTRSGTGGASARGPTTGARTRPARPSCRRRCCGSWCGRGWRAARAAATRSCTPRVGSAAGRGSRDAIPGRRTRRIRRKAPMYRGRGFRRVAGRFRQRERVFCTDRGAGNERGG